MTDPISTAAGAVSIVDRALAALDWLRGRRHLKQPALPLRPRHTGLELIAVSFRLDLRQMQPTIELQFSAINYLRRELTLTEVKVTQLSLGGPAIEHVQLAQEFKVPAQSSQTVWCRRHLMDSETRALLAERHRDWWMGSYAMVARARAGRRLYTYGPVASMAIEGWVFRPPT